MNTISVSVVSYRSSSSLSSVVTEYQEDQFVFLVAEKNIKFHQQESITIAFKETEVILSKCCDSNFTANAHSAIIKSIDEGIVLTSVVLAYHDIFITALVSTHIINQLMLKPEDKVIWLIQPSEISYLRGN